MAIHVITCIQTKHRIFLYFRLYRKKQQTVQSLLISQACQKPPFGRNCYAKEEEYQILHNGASGLIVFEQNEQELLRCCVSAMISEQYIFSQSWLQRQRRSSSQM